MPLGLTLKQKKQNELKYNKNGSSFLWMNPLWSNIGIQAPLLMKLSREIQCLLLACIKLGFKGVSLPL